MVDLWCNGEWNEGPTTCVRILSVRWADSFFASSRIIFLLVWCGMWFRMKYYAGVGDTMWGDRLRKRGCSQVRQAWSDVKLPNSCRRLPWPDYKSRPVMPPMSHACEPWVLIMEIAHLDCVSMSADISLTCRRAFTCRPYASASHETERYDKINAGNGTLCFNHRLWFVLLSCHSSLPPPWF